MLIRLNFAPSRLPPKIKNRYSAHLQVHDNDYDINSGRLITRVSNIRKSTVIHP